MLQPSSWRSRWHRVQTSLAELGAVMPLGAIALLLTNDRIFKATFHNAVTGKLSDLAICFLLPLLISATLGVIVTWTPARRLWVGAAVTTVLFSALEMSDVVGAGFGRAMAALLGGPIVLTRDPTDLLALAVVPLALAYGRWRGRRLHPPSRRRGASAAGAVALFGGVLALMADSLPDRCTSWSAPVTFQVQGDCGTNGLIVVEADAHFARLTITNVSALLASAATATDLDSQQQQRYLGTSCPYTLEQGEWEVNVGTSCTNGGNVDPIGDAGAIAADAISDASASSHADAGASTVDAGGPRSRCPATSRKCHAALEGGALWFSCVGEDSNLPLCRSRLTVFP